MRVDEAEADSGPQMQAPRYTYLPLLIPEIKEYLVELVKEPEEVTDEKDWWFEEDHDEDGVVSQGPCKWSVPCLHLASALGSD